MKRVLVNLVSAQTIPNYLFIKTMFRDGDEIMLITSQGFKEVAERFSKFLLPNTGDKRDISLVVFDNKNDEENIDTMINKIKSNLSKDDEYIVNITGGTKLMVWAVEKVFNEYNSGYYYIPLPKNVIIDLQTGKTINITTRINIQDYLSLYGRTILNSKTRSETETQECTQNFYERYNAGDFSVYDTIFENLRKVRNKKEVPFTEFIKGFDVKKEGFVQIPDIKEFITKINFPLNNKDRLSKSEIEYLTGGWFEEYIYWLIKDNIRPDDIALGIHLNATNNDLDVTFTKENKLFVIECKTGDRREIEIKDIVYKASSILFSLKGLSAESYIVHDGIFNASNDLSKVFDVMRLKYFGKKDLVIDNSQPIIGSIQKELAKCF